jgi:agmatinase
MEFAMPGFEFAAPMNFLALGPEDSDAERARVVVMPVPYDVTTSYRGGTREGPRAILEASAQVELYDREFGFEPALEWGVHTLPALSVSLESQESAIGSIASAVVAHASPDRLLVVLGGEHAVSIGVARGLHQVFGDFVTVQLDAHADLREAYQGTRFSHACAARRILEVSPEIVQLGIRSLDISEAEAIEELASAGDDSERRVTTFFADEMRIDNGAHRARLAERVRGRPVYLTIDVDVFDSAVMPATGTPEPGGLYWHDVLAIVRTVADSAASIIAFDCVELAPIPGMHAPDYLTAKLIYKVMALAMFARAA